MGCQARTKPCFLLVIQNGKELASISASQPPPNTHDSRRQCEPHVVMEGIVQSSDQKSIQNVGRGGETVKHMRSGPQLPLRLAQRQQADISASATRQSRLPRHWWKKGLWSRFATAISRGCATATERARLKAPPFSRGCLRTATKGPSTWAPGGRRGGGPLVAVLLANRD